MKVDRAFLMIAVALSAIACSDSPPPTSPITGHVPTLPQYQLAAAASGRTERGTEDDVLRLENFLPGLGGIYVDGQNIVVFVPSTTARQDALAKLAVGAVTLNLDPETRGQMVRGENIVLRPSSYAFSQLVAWSESGAGGVVRVPGVTGIDANEATNRLTIFVYDLSVVPRVFAVAEAAGIPADAIETSVSRAVSVEGLRAKYRPTGGGIQIENLYGWYCTIGLNTSNGDDDKGFYTASHCSGTYGSGSTGGIVYQPILSSGRIRTITINPAWDATDTNCAGYTRCAQVDGMYVSYDSATFWSSKVAIMTGLATINYGALYYGDRAGWWTNINLGGTSYWVGIDVDKVGRTTGWTRGQLENTCVHTTVDSTTTHVYRVLCADRVKGAYAGYGDSGSPVFVGHDATNSQVNALGILFAVDFSHGSAIDDGSAWCNNSECRYYYNRLGRLQLFIHAPY